MKTIQLVRPTPRRPGGRSALQAMAVIALALTIVACGQQPTIEGAANADGLVAVKHTGMDVVQVAPGTDLSPYRKLLIDGLSFSSVDIVDPNTSHSARYKDFVLSEADKQQLNQLYVQQVTKQLLKGGIYNITTQPAADTLRVTTELVKLEPNAPRESDEQFTSSARNDTYTRGAGSMTLESQVYDSVSGKRIAVLRNELTDSETWGTNNSVTNTAAVKRAFTRWASQLQKQLQQMPKS